MKEDLLKLDKITQETRLLGGYAYLKKIVGGKTTVDGGLVLTTMLGTGYEDTNGAYQIMSGISGFRVLLMPKAVLSSRCVQW